MKLIAIYNVWGDSLELLRGSIAQLRESVDYVLIVAQEISNAGEIDKKVYPRCNDLIDDHLVDRVITYEPVCVSLLKNETAKRQLGIDWAKQNGYTHFIHMDSDEYYHVNDFEAAKIEFLKSGLTGSFIDLWTYYKEPTLRLSKKESYFVPFIHKINVNTKCGIAYRLNYGVAVDPSRAINSPKIGFLKSVSMHHFSYIRRDIAKKLRNSTAKSRIDNQRVLDEYQIAKAGTHLHTLFNDVLVEVPNTFNIFIHEHQKT